MAAVCLSTGSSLASMMHQPRTAVEQILEDTLATPSMPCSSEDTDTSSTTSRSKPASKSKKRYRDEERWILERLDRHKSCLLGEGKALSSPVSMSSGSWENSLTGSDPVSALGILQLRRILRALGLLTIGTQQAVLAERLRAAVSSGVVESFVREARAVPSESFQCAVQKRKAKAMLSLVEALISTPATNSSSTATISSKHQGAPSQRASSKAALSKHPSDNSVHQDTNVQINQSGGSMTKTKHGGANSGQNTGEVSGGGGSQHPISNLGKSWKSDATSTSVPTGYRTTAVMVTVNSRAASIASDTPASPATSSPVKTLRAVFSSATAPEAKKAPVAESEEEGVVTNAKVPVETEVAVLSPPVVDTHKAPTSVKSFPSSSASSPIALKQKASPAVAPCSDESHSSSSLTPGISPSSDSSSSLSVLWMSKTTPKAAATVAPAATNGSTSYSNMVALKQVFSGSKSPPSGYAPAPWTAGSKVSAKAATTLGPAKVAALPKNNRGGGRVAALVGAFDAKVRKAATGTLSLNGNGKEERSELLVAGETKKKTGVAATVAANGGNEKFRATPNTQPDKQEQQQVPRIDRTLDPVRTENHPAQPEEHLKLKGGQVPPIKVTSDVIANDATQVLNPHSDTIAPTSNGEAENTDSPECSSSAPGRSPSEPVAKVATTSKTKEQVSPQGGWGPPIAVPLVKSISAPSSPTPSTASTATLSPAQPRSPASPSVSPKKFGTPSGSSSNPHGNTTAVGIPPASKSKWGPPRATPLLAKTTSSPASASTHLRTNASPASSLSRKSPTPASSNGAIGSATTSAVVNAPKAMVTPPSTVFTPTASVPKKPVTATRVGTSGKRPPPPSGPAPPVPPRPQMKPSTVPVTNMPYDRSASAKPLTSCYNPLLPSQLAGVFSTPSAALSASAGGVPNDQEGATAYPAPPPLTTGFSTSGPKFPSPPKVVAATSPSPVVVPEAKPTNKGKEIQVYYGDGQEDSSGKSDGRESDDEYHVNDSDSGSDEDDDDPALKILEPSVTPDWAKGKAVAEALETQYGGEYPVNPNQIFVDFFTCNLEIIFDAKKKKWARSSTGDWMTDRLTVAEKLAYDRAMGYTSIEKSKNSRERSSRNKASLLRSSRNC